MSKVVGFLEALSVDARALSEMDYLQAVDKAGFDAATRQALLAQDAVALTTITGARANVMAFVLPAEDEPDTDSPERQDPEPKEGDNDRNPDVRAA